MQRLEGKVALVTGAARGIGRAIAARFATEGAQVVVGDVDVEAGRQTASALAASGAGCRFLPLDVTDPVQVRVAVDEAVHTLGRIDVLVNNAGLKDRAPFLDLDLVLWERILRTNLTGAFLCGQAVARHMASRGSGRIVNLVSISGQRGGTGRAAYGASKAALINLTETMAIELAEYGILVNAIAPGPIRDEAPDPDEPRSRATLARLILKRFGRPDDVASAAVFLASEECTFTTGHVLNVDGGFDAAGVMYDPLPVRWRRGQETTT